MVNTTTASVSGLVGEREVKDLPLNGRSFDNLITLNPGAINYSAMKSANTSTSNGNTFSVAGRRTGDNLFLLNGIEYTGSSQLAITPGRRQRRSAGDRRRPRVQRAHRHLFGRIRQARRRAGQRGDAVGHQCAAWLAVRVSAQQRARRAQLLRRKAPRSSLPRRISSAARWAARSGKIAVPVRQLRRIPPGAGARATSAWFRTPSSPGHFAAQRDHRRVHAESGDAALHVFWPAPNGPELLVNGFPSGTAFSYNNPKQSIREDFGTAANGLQAPRSRHAFGRLHDRRRQQPDPAGRSFVRLLLPRCACRWPACRKRTSFRREMLNTFRAGFSRAGFNLRFVAAGVISAQPLVRDRRGPGGIVIRRRRDHHRRWRHHFGRPEQRRRRLESPKSVHLCRRLADHQGQPSDQLRRLVPAAPGQ